MKILPGFITPRGSSACFTACITVSASAPCSCSRNSRLPMPTPCSPLQDPPKASARATIFLSSSHARASPSGSGWHHDHGMEIPVPDMPNNRRCQARGGMISSFAPKDRLIQPEKSGLSHLSRCLFARASSARHAQYASCRACQSLARAADASTAQANPSPLEPQKQSPPPDRPVPPHPASVPWNSKNSVGSAGQSRPASNTQMHAAICTSSSNSIRATGIPVLQDRDDSLHSILQCLRTGRSQMTLPPGSHAAATGSR